MFQTFELQYLKKLVKGEVRDFPSPKPFHALKVECLGGDTVKPSAKVSGKFPMPISALVGDFDIQPCEFSDGTPPIARTFLLSTEGLVEFTKFNQGLFQGVWVLYFLTGVQRQIGVHAEVRPYIFTCSGQNRFAGVVSDDIKPIRSNRVAKYLDIADVPMPIAMVVIQDIAMLEHKLLFYFVPFFEGEANCPLWNFRDFPFGYIFKNLVACLELRRTIPPLAFELWGTDTSTPFSVGNPSKEPLVGSVNTDNHLVKGISWYPRPVFMSALEQLRQMRLQPIPPGILAKHAIVSLLQCQKVVMDIAKVIKQVAQAFDLRVVAYLIFVGSHGFTSYQSLTPFKWVGRHVTLRLRLNCLPTGIDIIPQFGLKVKCFLTLWSFPRGRFFLPNLKDWVSKPFN